VIRDQDGKWVTIRLMQEPVKALMQSYLRTKAKNYKEYLQTMELKANSSNNTIYADADGHIAYFHGNFIPRRDTALRLHQAGGWKRPGNGVAGAADRRGDAASAGSRRAAISST
jgi:acyl-homoserine-lactone acylase